MEKSEINGIKEKIDSAVISSLTKAIAYYYFLEIAADPNPDNIKKEDVVKFYEDCGISISEEHQL